MDESIKIDESVKQKKKKKGESKIIPLVASVFAVIGLCLCFVEIGSNLRAELNRRAEQAATITDE